jgi:hypothetical protein
MFQNPFFGKTALQRSDNRLGSIKKEAYFVLDGGGNWMIDEFIGFPCVFGMSRHGYRNMLQCFRDGKEGLLARWE